MAACEKQVEWRITTGDGSPEILVPEAGPASRVWLGLQGLIAGLALKVRTFSQKMWRMGADDPKKVIHGLKVGLALTVVSFLYYITPLYDRVGQSNAVWAVMTVVVVFDNTAGATISKSLNRIFATIAAGLLAVGIHCAVESVSPPGREIWQTIIIGVSVFIIGAAATFARFIPSVKAQYDYGFMIFILTYSLVSVSGYRVADLFLEASQRMLTIVTATLVCMFITTVFWPIWAGEGLYILITRNMDKLADSLDLCLAKNYEDSRGLIENEEFQKKLLGYRCVLSSKATEEIMANFARWEPPHDRFYFRHPWKQYVKIGASMRDCAYCIEALNSCINSENQQAPEYIKKHISNISLKVSSYCSIVIRELGTTIKTMKKSSSIHYMVGEMNTAVEELRNDFKSLPNLFNPLTAVPEADADENEKIEEISRKMATDLLVDIIPLATFASLVTEIVTRVNRIVVAVEELADLVGFEPAIIHDESVKKKPNKNNIFLVDVKKDKETIKAFQLVYVPFVFQN